MGEIPTGADLGKNLTRAQVENLNKCSRVNKKIWKLIEKKETIEIWLGLEPLSPSSGSAPEVCLDSLFLFEYMDMRAKLKWIGNQHNKYILYF